jgi:Fe2+ transport system protein FeoA
MIIKPLSELKQGEKGKIVKIGGQRRFRRLLLDMGLVSGSNIEMERLAPLGDPIEFKVKGYNLSLRREEADCIKVEVS